MSAVADGCQSRSFQQKGLSFVGPFCRKGLCSLLQPATRSAFLKRQHVDVERTSALVVRLTAKVQPGRLDLPKSATAPWIVALLS